MPSGGIVNTDIVHRETLTVMVDTYTAAVKEIEQAYEILEAAQNRMRAVFVGQSWSFATLERNNTTAGKESAAKIIENIRREAWSSLIERLEVRRILSIKRRQELDRQMRDGELPEITVENVLSLMEQSVANVQTYVDEAVLEVFDFLRPPGSRLKTNTEYELGKRVILGWMIEKGYGRGKYSVRYGSRDRLTSLDNIMLMMDGKGTVKTHYGELCDAICDSKDGNGETAYFRFKCYGNGNLHLEFLRSDLVEKINKIAGGNRLGKG